MKLIANIESFDDRYIASIESIKGMVVQANSIENVCKELLMSLKVKISFDYGVDMNSIQHKEFKNEQELIDFEKQMKLDNGKAKKEINLDMSFC